MRETLRNYHSELFKESASVACRQSFRRLTLYRRDSESGALNNLLADPDGHIHKAIVHLKLGNSATVGLVDVGGRRLVLKRYNIKSFWHGVKRAIQPSRAAISWRNAHLLQFIGVRTTPPVGMIEERYGPFRSRAYFVTEEVPGPDAFSYFTTSGADSHQREIMGQALVDLIVLMGEARVIQRDTKAMNFIMSPLGPVVVDLDGIEQHRWSYTFKRAYKNCWRPLMDSWKNCTEANILFRELLKQAGINYL